MKNKLKTNIIYNILYQILLVILPFITAPYISRVLGSEGIGIYSYNYTIASYFGLFIMLGISNHGNRSISLLKDYDDKKKLGKIFANIYAIQIFMSFIVIFAYLVYAFLIVKEEQIISLICILVVLSYSFDITWVYFGLEKFKTTVLKNVIIKILTVISIFVFVKNKEDIWIYTLIMSISLLIANLWLFIPLRKYISFALPSFKGCIQNIKPILVLFIPVIAYSIYKLMDKIMLGAMTTMQEVGYYENAEKIINIPIGVVTAFSTVMMPYISRMISRGENNNVEHCNKLSFKYFSIIIFAISFGLIGISDLFVPIYFGTEFIKCKILIAGLSISVIFITWANITRTQYLIPNKRDKVYVISTIVGAITNLILNLILIPIWGSFGAVVGTIGAETSVFITQYIFVRRVFNISRYLKPILYIFPISLLMSLLVYGFGKIMSATIIALLLQVLIGGICYVLCILLILFITKDEILYNFVYRKRGGKYD